MFISIVMLSMSIAIFGKIDQIKIRGYPRSFFLHTS